MCILLWFLFYHAPSIDATIQVLYRQLLTATAAFTHSIAHFSECLYLNKPTAEGGCSPWSAKQSGESM